MRPNRSLARSLAVGFAAIAAMFAAVDLLFAALEYGRTMLAHLEPALYVAAVGFTFFLFVLIGCYVWIRTKLAHRKWLREHRTSGMRAFDRGDYKTAFLTLLPHAASGDADAQAKIGAMYQLGLGRIPDEHEAMKWYTKSSEQGNGLASNNLGTMALMRGDRDAAARWYEKARAQGFEHSPKPEWVP